MVTVTLCTVTCRFQKLYVVENSDLENFFAHIYYFVLNFRHLFFTCQNLHSILYCVCIITSILKQIKQNTQNNNVFGVFFGAICDFLHVFSITSYYGNVSNFKIAFLCNMLPDLVSFFYKVVPRRLMVIVLSL